MRSTGFRSTLAALYAAGFVALAVTAWAGRNYYPLPIIERPRAEMHDLLKPGGIWGHAMGIVGSAMLLLLFLYSARKRRKFGLRKWKLARWLDVHIWFGIMGPLFITLHSAFKFGGIVSVSYFSMMAVMLSGFLGRYIYIQIPRDDAGTALPVRQIDEEIQELGRRIREKWNAPPGLMAAVERRMGASGGTPGAGDLLAMPFRDLLRPVRRFRLRGLIRRSYPGIPPEAAAAIVRLASRKSVLERRRALLTTVHRVFHYWHVIHKPFAIVMVLIMAVHIAVVVAMGYRWVF